MHISRTTYPDFTKFSVHVVYDHSLVLLWQHCNTLCTSGLVNDVIFCPDGCYGTGDTSRVIWLTSSSTDFTSQHILKLTHQRAALGWTGAESDVYDSLVFFRTTSFDNAQSRNEMWTAPPKLRPYGTIQICLLLLLLLKTPWIDS